MSQACEMLEPNLVLEDDIIDLEAFSLLAEEPMENSPGSATGSELPTATSANSESGGNWQFGPMVAVCSLLMLGSVIAVVGVMFFENSLRSGRKTEGRNAPGTIAPFVAKSEPAKPNVKTSLEIRSSLLAEGSSPIESKPVESESPKVDVAIAPLVASQESEKEKPIAMPPSGTDAKRPQLKIDVDPIDRSKAATVFVKVKGKKKQSSGSGFLLKREGDDGKVITNAHVVAPEEDTLVSIECVFYSGLPNEFTVPCKIDGLNQVDDLAVLSVKSSQLPDELLTSQVTDIRETQPIFVVGFPFGEMLKTNDKNPNLSISKKIISSIRRDSSGDIVTLQIDGGINPGNSGGPIVTEDGLLAGIAVAKLKKADIGFAIPTQVLHNFMVGKLGKPMLREIASLSGELTLKIGITVELFDPTRNIQAVDVLAIRKAQGRLPKSNRGALDEAFREWQPYRLKIEGSSASGDFEIPKETSSMEFQMRWLTKDGMFYFSHATDVHPVVQGWDVIKLPARFSDVDVAAGGKYLVFHLPSLKRLDVFDTLSQQFVKSIPVQGEGLCTAGMDKIVFVQTATKRLFQWNLKTFNLDRTETLDFSQPPSFLAMGNASQGPLFVGGFDNNFFKFNLVDLETLKPIENGTLPKPLRMTKNSVVRVAGSGKAFTFDGPDERGTLFTDAELRFQGADREIERYLIPNHNGKQIYSPFGIQSPDTKKAKVELAKCFCNIPNLDGNGYLVLSLPDNYSANPSSPVKGTVCLPGGKVIHRDLSIPLFQKYGTRDLDQRIFLHSANKTLIVLPQVNNEIHIRVL